MTAPPTIPMKPAERTPEVAVAPLDTIDPQDIGAGAAAFDEWSGLMSQSGTDKLKLGSDKWERSALDANAGWIVDRNRDGYSFIDIGGDGSSNKSSFYVIEKRTLHQIGGKVYKGAPTAIKEARSTSKPSARPKSKIICPL